MQCVTDTWAEGIGQSGCVFTGRPRWDAGHRFKSAISTWEGVEAEEAKMRAEDATNDDVVSSCCIYSKNDGWPENKTFSPHFAASD